ncbi:hypothetical protein BU16DRAFT_566810 [Lophium mytilinum]|uniref:Uncharacterized protein n=1 Tax=Lophium mytilinum TaxID=390894 RepID=A0A6A6QC40_9PEZI|nr:hypothetical protein BU16DRAFT_566810 [Lophium mytilinum]
MEAFNRRLREVFAPNFKALQERQMAHILYVLMPLHQSRPTPAGLLRPVHITLTSNLDLNRNKFHVYCHGDDIAKGFSSFEVLKGTWSIPQHRLRATILRPFHDVDPFKGTFIDGKLEPRPVPSSSYERSILERANIATAVVERFNPGLVLGPSMWRPETTQFISEHQHRAAQELSRNSNPWATLGMLGQLPVLPEFLYAFFHGKSLEIQGYGSATRLYLGKAIDFVRSIPQSRSKRMTSTGEINTTTKNARPKKPLIRSKERISHAHDPWAWTSTALKQRSDTKKVQKKDDLEEEGRYGKLLRNLKTSQCKDDTASNQSSNRLEFTQRYLSTKHLFHARCQSLLIPSPAIIFKRNSGRLCGAEFDLDYSGRINIKVRGSFEVMAQARLALWQAALKRIENLEAKRRFHLLCQFNDMAKTAVHHNKTISGQWTANLKLSHPSHGERAVETKAAYETHAQANVALWKAALNVLEELNPASKDPKNLLRYRYIRALLDTRWKAFGLSKPDISLEQDNPDFPSRWVAKLGIEVSSGKRVIRTALPLEVKAPTSLNAELAALQMLEGLEKEGLLTYAPWARHRYRERFGLWRLSHLPSNVIFKCTGLSANIGARLRVQLELTGEARIFASGDRFGTADEAREAVCAIALDSLDPQQKTREITYSSIQKDFGFPSTIKETGTTEIATNATTTVSDPNTEISTAAAPWGSNALKEQTAISYLQRLCRVIGYGPQNYVFGTNGPDYYCNLTIEPPYDQPGQVFGGRDTLYDSQERAKSAAALEAIQYLQNNALFKAWTRFMGKQTSVSQTNSMKSNINNRGELLLFLSEFCLHMRCDSSFSKLIEQHDAGFSCEIRVPPWPMRIFGGHDRPFPSAREAHKAAHLEIIHSLYEARLFAWNEVSDEDPSVFSEQKSAIGFLHKFCLITDSGKPSFHTYNDHSTGSSCELLVPRLSEAGFGGRRNLFPTKRSANTAAAMEAIQFLREKRMIRMPGVEMENISNSTTLESTSNSTKTFINSVVAPLKHSISKEKNSFEFIHLFSTHTKSQTSPKVSFEDQPAGISCELRIPQRPEHVFRGKGKIQTEARDLAAWEAVKYLHETGHFGVWDTTAEKNESTQKDVGLPSASSPNSIAPTGSELVSNMATHADALRLVCYYAKSGQPQFSFRMHGTEFSCEVRISQRPGHVFGGEKLYASKDRASRAAAGEAVQFLRQAMDFQSDASMENDPHSAVWSPREDHDQASGGLTFAGSIRSSEQQESSLKQENSALRETNIKLKEKLLTVMEKNLALMKLVDENPAVSQEIDSQQSDDSVSGKTVPSKHATPFDHLEENNSMRPNVIISSPSKNSQPSSLLSLATTLMKPSRSPTKPDPTATTTKARIQRPRPKRRDTFNLIEVRRNQIIQGKLSMRPVQDLATTLMEPSRSPTKLGSTATTTKARIQHSGPKRRDTFNLTEVRGNHIAEARRNLIIQGKLSMREVQDDTLNLTEVRRNIITQGKLSMRAVQDASVISPTNIQKQARIRRINFRKDVSFETRLRDQTTSRSSADSHHFRSF